MVYINISKALYNNATKKIKRVVRKGPTTSPKLFTIGMEDIFMKLNCMK